MASHAPAGTWLEHRETGAIKVYIIIPFRAKMVQCVSLSGRRCDCDCLRAPGGLNYIQARRCLGLCCVGDFRVAISRFGVGIRQFGRSPAHDLFEIVRLAKRREYALTYDPEISTPLNGKKRFFVVFTI